MKEEKKLTCIGCPMGCELTILIDDGEVISVTGNHCNVGKEYAKKEVTNPTRIVTSSVKVLHGKEKMVSVKTNKDISKALISQCIDALRGLEVTAPIHIGDVLVKGICGTDVDIVATKQVDYDES